MRLQLLLVRTESVFEDNNGESIVEVLHHKIIAKCDYDDEAHIGDFYKQYTDLMNRREEGVKYSLRNNFIKDEPKKLNVTDLVSIINSRKDR